MNDDEDFCLSCGEFMADDIAGIGLCYDCLEDSLGKKEISKTIILSPSSISLFLDCKRCFWLQVNKKVKRPAGGFPSLPSGIDRILKQHFDDFRANGTNPPELIENNINARLFDDISLLKKWRNWRSGLKATFENIGVTLIGAIDDLLVSPEGKMIVFDFKTRGFAPTKDTQSFYEHQIMMYALLLSKNGYQVEDYAYLLFYYPIGVNGDGTFKFKTSAVKVVVNTHIAEELLQDAVRTLKGDIPEVDNECEFCKWNSV